MDGGENCYVSFDDGDHPSTLKHIPVITTPNHLGDYLLQQNIDEFWIALPLSAEGRVKNYFCMNYVIIRSPRVIF